jgi:deoxyribose-phosphate aldolase
MTQTHDILAFDKLIDAARRKFRELQSVDPFLFDGIENPRVEETIGARAPFGTIGVPAGVDVSTTQGLIRGIDLTLLDKNASASDVGAIAKRAADETAATVCVYPEHVAAVQTVTGGNPPPIAVVGFPSVPVPYEEETEKTLAQTRAAIKDGAKEIDMVLALAFMDGNPDYAAHYKYIRRVVVEAAQSGCPVKVILETAYLTDEQKVEACLLAKMAGARFVKTSTGFALDDLMRPELPKSQKGAVPYDVALMRRAVGDTTLDESGLVVPMGVKASGGVRNREQAIAVYEAGASRIGASGGIDVRTDAEKKQAPQEAGRPTSTGQRGSPTPY